MDRKEKNLTLKPIGEAIKELLVKNKYSYQELANKTGVSKPYIAEIISKNKTPHKDKLEKIAKAFNLDPYYFREYRLMRLNTYIGDNPIFLNYDNEEEIINIINMNYAISNFIKNNNISELGEDTTYIARKLAEQAYQRMNETEKKEYNNLTTLGFIVHFFATINR